MQVRWYLQGKLTEGAFVYFQVFIWSFLIATGSLAISSTTVGLIGIYIGAILFFPCIFIGFPVARWFYRRFIPNKSWDGQS